MVSSVPLGEEIRPVMSASVAFGDRHDAGAPPRTERSGVALAAAVLGFFVITLDAVVVNVALPSIRADLGGGVAGLQWVVDGYTLMFAALLLTAGAVTDRIGARRAFGVGLAAFTVASLACGLAPTLAALVASRFVQGMAAAVTMPASMALIRQAFPDPVARGRAVATWAMGGAVAASSGPVLGGVLDLVDWRWIFVINLPVGVLALALLAGCDARRGGRPRSTGAGSSARSWRWVG
jgi:DHA2 family methylenomycin A resistance protein-like MFS transporter